MFTGIIEEVGSIKDIIKTKYGKRISIASNQIIEDINEGDSISINGVCLTACKISSNNFIVDLVEETLNIKKVLKQFKNGQMIIVVDDEDRENEGDFIIAAEKATPENINFMMKEARGLICISITNKIAKI